MSVKCQMSHVKCFNKGFALLFAMLASSVLLSVAVAIWSISLREVIFSSFGRESETAFFVADTGMECALYWDFKGAFATSTSRTSLPSSNCPQQSPKAIRCGDQPITPMITSCNSLNAVTEFSLTSTAGVCADVVITKTGNNQNSFSTTKIESRGHNTCVFSSPTLVERGLRVTY